MKNNIRIGTRKSALAIWQSEYVGQCIVAANPELSYELVPFSTKGDERLDVALADIGDKGLFTAELERALLEDRIDIAVHSLKDMPTELPTGLYLAAYTPRHDASDAFLSKHGENISDLPQGAVVGTSSLRRKAQLLALRPDFVIKNIRGNVQTRIRKFQEEEYDAVVMATAGLERMGLDEHITRRLLPKEFIPAVGQGIVVVEAAEHRSDLLDIVKSIDDADARAMAIAERSFLHALEGGCQVPMGAYAVITEKTLSLEGFIASLDGQTFVKDRLSGAIENAENIGRTLAQTLRQHGGEEILKVLRAEDMA